jgi:hypothetical protein
LAGLFCAMPSYRLTPKPAILEPSDQFSLAGNVRRGEHRSSNGARRVLGQAKVSAVREVEGDRVLVDTVPEVTCARRGSRRVRRGRGPTTRRGRGSRR